MAVEVQRNLFEKLDTLDTSVTDLVIKIHQLRSQLEEARRSAEICVGATDSQFGTELRLSEAAHEQTLEAVVSRYAEKEVIRAIETVAAVDKATTEPRDINVGPSFTTVIKSRPAK